MVETVNAIYENGMFKPLEHIHIVNGQKVKLIIETEDVTSASDILKSAADVYTDLSKEDISDIEDIAFDRKDFFALV
ncbi:MAG: antitoxin family protein [Spirochaetales bacterium]|nr:antitoxin family protein [Spirochaetales bacterium]